MRLGVGGRGMFLGEFAMLVSCSCVLFGIFVLAERVVMLGLVMMMCCSMVLSGREMMMLMRWMLRRLCHVNFLLYC